MRKLALAASFVALSAAVPAQQSKPNFSGTWVVISPAEHAGQEETIVHTAAELRLGHASEGGGHNPVYKLDGSESRFSITAHGVEIVTFAKARWEGDTLVLDQHTQLPEGPKMTARATFSLNADGHLVRGMIGTMGEAPMPPITVVMKKK
jgi:hypothetical protein